MDIEVSVAVRGVGSSCISAIACTPSSSSRHERVENAFLVLGPSPGASAIDAVLVLGILTYLQGSSRTRSFLDPFYSSTGKILDGPFFAFGVFLVGFHVSYRVSERLKPHI